MLISNRWIIGASVIKEVAKFSNLKKNELMRPILFLFDTNGHRGTEDPLLEILIRKK